MKKLCIVIPYRDREAHLKGLLPRLNACLEATKIPHQILVVEQSDEKKFNRGMMKNIGAKWAIDNNYDYVCFHDVDMIPVLGKVDYGYENFACHLAVEVEQFGYDLPYAGFFGGVLIIPTQDLVKMNGYRNDYWGWGAEDDDFFTRCTYTGIETKRKSCRFDSYNHERDLVKEDYDKNLETLRAFWKDPSMLNENGLNTIEYSINTDVQLNYEGVEYRKINVEI